MRKSEIERRQNAIRELIFEKGAIRKKEEFKEKLEEKGFIVSLSTISNDLNDLEIVKDHRKGYTFIKTEEHNKNISDLGKMIKEDNCYRPAPHITIVKYDRELYTAAEISATIMKSREFYGKDPSKIAISESLNGNLVIISEEVEFKTELPVIHIDDIREAMAKENKNS